MRSFRNSALALASTLILAIAVSAQTSPSQFEGIKIGNFGQMTDKYYRGAQPMPDDYASLAKLGINTIIDLRNDPTDYEKSAAEAVGIKYINLPMSGWRSPKDADIQTFLDIMNDPSTGKVFVHCKAGIHRTGITGAIYRMQNEGWDYDKSYAEMKNYNFSTGLVHGALKRYVKRYAAMLTERRAAEAAARTAAAAGHASTVAN
ncbi:MAG: fused DSP-PTPase phosphatase/NAD kinase-like protein [Pyrinomonadaceae bacterium]